MQRDAIRFVTAAAFVLGLAAPSFAQQPQQTPARPPSTTGGGFTTPVVQSPPPSTTGGALTTPGTTIAPSWDLSAGYQTLHVPDRQIPFGLNVDGAKNFGPWSIVAELGWMYDNDDALDTTLNAMNFGGGPRWTSRRGKVWPFVQALAGAVYQNVRFDAFDSSDSATNFMVQPGAGAVFVVADGLGIVGQVDYRRLFTDETETGESGQNQFRVFFGLRMILD